MNERVQRDFYAVDDHSTEPVAVVGFACDGLPDVWWVPRLGFSGWYGIHVFDTRLDALRGAAKAAEVAAGKAVRRSALLREAVNAEEARSRAPSPATPEAEG